MTYNLYMIKDLLDNYLHHTLAVSHLTADRLICPIKNVLISHSYSLSMPSDWLRIISARDWKEQRISEDRFYLIWNWDQECENRISGFSASGLRRCSVICCTEAF